MTIETSNNIDFKKEVYNSEQKRKKERKKERSISIITLNVMY